MGVEERPRSSTLKGSHPKERLVERLDKQMARFLKVDLEQLTKIAKTETESRKTTPR